MVVRDGGNVAGTLGMAEVLSHYASHSHLVSLRLSRARSLQELADAARGMTPLVRSLHAQGARVVPIIADEARTFGMEGMFRQLGIYSPQGQMYKPVDRDQLMYYREDAAGQVLEEGITEAGAFASWMAAATSYSTNDVPMLPFYIYYSMFGFQRIGDSAWQAADMRARGFLLGATAGRTTLNGEGLQHEDGHSHLLAGAIPNCRAYDPTFAGEVAVIVQEGMRRMLDEHRSGTSDHSRRLWTVLIFMLWHAIFVEGSVTPRIEEPHYPVQL